MNNACDNLGSRLWRKDVTLWNQPVDANRDILERLGWLDSAQWMQQQLDEVQEWVDKVVTGKQFDRVVVLGMGGSSLAPEVFSRLFDHREDYLELMVLDSTSPEMVNEILKSGIDRCLFIVASKSGTTLETISLYRFFFHQIEKISDQPGRHFVAITDPESWLASHGEQAGFARIFLNPADIGGRYSALSYFGLVPAALFGVDIAALVERTMAYIERTRSDNPELNSALTLGIFIGQQAAVGRDKMVLQLPGELQSLGTWIEQLVAESTGKGGRGILPVYGDVAIDSEDQFTVGISFADNISLELIMDSAAGRIEWSVPDPLDIGAEFFKWEFATAIAASYLQVNPFDQPDVEQAKTITREFIGGKDKLAIDNLVETDHYRIQLIGGTRVSEVDLSTQNCSSFPLTPVPGGYIGLLGYLPMQAEVARIMETIRSRIMARCQLISTVGFGPRYLHSSGQLHKGGAGNGCFIQFVSKSEIDFEIPGLGYTFGQLLTAQADGDMAALAARNLPIMRVELKGDRLSALEHYASEWVD